MKSILLIFSRTDIEGIVTNKIWNNNIEKTTVRWK